MSALRTAVTSTDHITGQLDAPITVVEYGDFQCPYCRAAEPVTRALRAQFSDQLCFAFRQFPLVDLHEQALDAARLAELAADHGKFWQAHDLLFDNQDNLGAGLYAQICAALGIADHEWEAATRDGRYDERIARDEEGGIRSGVNGTPTFFLNGVRLDGGVDELEQRIGLQLS